MRARLAASARPDRIFQVTLEAAKKAGLVGRKRVLDSTPLYDAVATMDTTGLIRSGIRGVFKAAGADLGAQLRAVIRRDDDYATAGKPVCDYDDPGARKVLVDALAKDALAVLRALDGRTLDGPLAQAGALLATLVGQDLDEGDDGVFRITRRVAEDRVISTVDTGGRHGHKTSARGFDGDKGHVAIDPDSEVITATAVTAGNTGDAASAGDLPGSPGWPCGANRPRTNWASACPGWSSSPRACEVITARSQPCTWSARWKPLSSSCAPIWCLTPRPINSLVSSRSGWRWAPPRSRSPASPRTARGSTPRSYDRHDQRRRSP